MSFSSPTLNAESPRHMIASDLILFFYSLSRCFLLCIQLFILLSFWLTAYSSSGLFLSRILGSLISFLGTDSMTRVYMRACADSASALRTALRKPVYRPVYQLSHARSYRVSRAIPGYATRLQPPPPTNHARTLATGTATGTATDQTNETVTEGGPLEEYNTRVQQGRLRDDPYQRRTPARYTVPVKRRKLTMSQK